jgi:general secretion pathway protein L
MRRPRIGLFLHDGRLTIVALTGHGRLEHFVIEDAADLGATLAAELQARGLTGRRIRVGLDRRSAVVKAIELPRAAGGDLAHMVGFDLERHVPFPAEDIRFGWTELPSGPEEPHRVLVAAAERRTVEQPLGLLAGAKRRAGLLVVACHELPALLARGLPARRAIWVHRHRGGTDLLFVDGPLLVMSRRPADADAEGIAREIQRSLPLVRWSSCDAVWLSGDDAEAWGAALGAILRVPVSAPPYAPARAPLIAALPAEDQGTALLALAVAAGPRSPALNLLPEGERPWAPTLEQRVTGGVVGVTVLLALTLAFTHAIKTERYVGRLAQEIHRLDPDAKVVEGLAAELARKRRVLSALESAQDRRVQALPVLRELTETLPTGAWLQALTADRRGIELTGQAEVASTLIPLLEASDRLERVEFTSPVTKTENKEQFRIRAAWERHPPSGAHPATSRPAVVPSGEGKVNGPGH